MDCIAAGVHAASGPFLPDAGWPPASVPGASASLCMRCELRSRCVGGVAAEAGTTQLQQVLAGRSLLRRGEVLYAQGEAFEQVYVVRSGALKSTLRRDDGEQVGGFHFAGELVGVDGALAGRQRATVVALEETEVCAMRFAPRPGQPSGMRALLARLWDMMSCELLRERAHQALLATLPPSRRVAAFLASVSGRTRARRGALVLPAMEVASYLRVAPQDVAGTALHVTVTAPRT